MERIDDVRGRGKANMQMSSGSRDDSANQSHAAVSDYATTVTKHVNI